MFNSTQWLMILAHKLVTINSKIEHIQFFLLSFYVGLPISIIIWFYFFFLFLSLWLHRVLWPLTCLCTVSNKILIFFSQYHIVQWFVGSFSMLMPICTKLQFLERKRVVLSQLFPLIICLVAPYMKHSSHILLNTVCDAGAIQYMQTINLRQNLISTVYITKFKS